MNQYPPNIKEECVSPDHYLNVPGTTNQRYTPSPESHHFPLPDTQALLMTNTLAGQSPIYAPSISPSQHQSLPSFDAFPQTYQLSPISHQMNMPLDTDIANVVINQFGVSDNTGNAADITQTNEMLADDAQNVGTFSDLDLNHISMSDSEIIRFMENTEQTMEDSMSDSLNQLNLQRSS